MAYSQHGREANLGPWVSEIRYASTTAPEFRPSSLGERWHARAYRRHGAPLLMGWRARGSRAHRMIAMGAWGSGRGDGLGGYGDAYSAEDLGFNLFKAIGGIFKGVATKVIPIVGPAIGTALDAFKKRATGAALEDPAVQAQLAQAAKEQAGVGFQKLAPWLVGGLAVVVLMQRRR